jgi:hypothetical protein
VPIAPVAPGTTLKSAPAGTVTASVVGTGAGGASKTTSTTLQVTAAAGRLARGIEMAAAAAGVVVIAFL